MISSSSEPNIITSGAGFSSIFAAQYLRLLLFLRAADDRETRSIFNPTAPRAHCNVLERYSLLCGSKQQQEKECEWLLRVVTKVVVFFFHFPHSLIFSSGRSGAAAESEKIANIFQVAETQHPSSGENITLAHFRIFQNGKTYSGGLYLERLSNITVLSRSTCFVFPS